MKMAQRSVVWGSQNLENIVELKKKARERRFFRENHFKFFKNSKNNLFAISVSGIEIFFRQIELNCLFDSAFNASKL